MTLHTLTAERLADVREQLALDIGGTGDWRSRVQAEHPDDKRNGEAADMLGKLEASVANIPDELLARYDALWQVDDPTNMSADWSERTRRIGFYTSPSSAEALVRGFVEEWEAELAPPSAPEPKPRRRAIRS